MTAAQSFPLSCAVRASARTGGEGQGGGALPQAAATPSADTAPFTGTRQGAFVGARRLANGTPVYARPLPTPDQSTLF